MNLTFKLKNAMKRDICLTLNLDITDSVFEKYSNYKKLNKGEISNRNSTVDFTMQNTCQVARIQNQIFYLHLAKQSKFF